MANYRKAAMIGCGYVGSASVFALMQSGIFSEIVMIDVDKEKAKVQKDIDFLSGKLNNQGFLAKAPEKLIEAEKAKLAKAEEKMAKIEQSMAAMK